MHGLPYFSWTTPFELQSRVSDWLLSIMKYLWHQLFYITTLLSTTCFISSRVKGDECGNETATWSRNNEDWISLNETGYCFVNECTIRIKESNVLLNIINKTTNWIVAINATNLFTVPATSSDSYCSLEGPKTTFFIFFMVVIFIAVTSSFLNIVLHLAVKELRTISGIIIIGICGTIIIVFLCTMIIAVFQYVYRVNGHSVICAVFKYSITSVTLTYTMLKATYLFHFAYLMYRSYTLRPCKKESKNLLLLYCVVIATASIICTVLLIVIDLLHERTVFAMYNGYCADYFRSPGVSDKVLIALLVIITATGIVFFVIAMILYCLATNHFCTCGSMTRQGNIRVSITLISAVALGALLLIILLLAGVAGGSSVISASISSVCVEQIILLIVFLTSKKTREKLWKHFKREETETERGLGIATETIDVAIVY